MKNRLKSQIMIFIAIVTLVQAVIYVMMFQVGAEHMSPTWSFLSMWSPALAAILTSVVFKESIGNYGWKLGKGKYLGYAFLAPVGIAIIAYGFCWISGLTEFYGDEARNYKWARMLGFETPVPILVGVFSKIILGGSIYTIFILGEEIGWSGFLTPRLLKVTSIPITSLLVGLYWSIWHFPAIIFGVYGYGTPLWVALPGFTLLLVGLSFFRTYLVSKSKSLWIGVLLHVGQNTILVSIFFELTVKTKYAAYFVSETGIITGVVSILSATTFWVLKKRKSILAS